MFELLIPTDFLIYLERCGVKGVDILPHFVISRALHAYTLNLLVHVSGTLHRLQLFTVEMAGK